MEGVDLSRRLQAALAAAPRRFPRTQFDPLNVGALFATMSDRELFDYITSFRTFLRERLRYAQSRSTAIAALATAERAMAPAPNLPRPPKIKAEVVSQPVISFERKQVAPNNRAIREAISDHRRPSATEWAAWWDDNPNYSSKKRSGRLPDGDLVAETVTPPRPESGHIVSEPSLEPQSVFKRIKTSAPDADPDPDVQDESAFTSASSQELHSESSE